MHTITSLTGFEALLRGRDVTTYGAPFYAVWGLTTDLGKTPARRQRPITVEELVHRTLINYPRYWDPLTKSITTVEGILHGFETGGLPHPVLPVTVHGAGHFRFCRSILALGLS